jgi:hypothetical protein
VFCLQEGQVVLNNSTDNGSASDPPAQEPGRTVLHNWRSKPVREPRVVPFAGNLLPVRFSSIAAKFVDQLTTNSVTNLEPDLTGTVVDRFAKFLSETATW